MSRDVIDAADMLLAELDGQAATLQESGALALSNGKLAEARFLIDAIEKTQGFRSRAEELKSEITKLQDTFLPSPSLEASSHAVLALQDAEERKQDRTDPAVMNAKRQRILRDIEKEYGVRLDRRSATTYRDDKSNIAVVCTMSKWHADNQIYWYAYHPYQDEFLNGAGKSYFTLGMMDVDRAVVLPLKVIRENLQKLNTTNTPDGRTYWHIHIQRNAKGEFFLQRARGAPPLQLAPYMLTLSAP